VGLAVLAGKDEPRNTSWDWLRDSIGRIAWAALVVFFSSDTGRWTAAGFPFFSLSTFFLSVW